MEQADAHEVRSRRRLRQGRQGGQRHLGPAAQDARPVVDPLRPGRPRFPAPARPDLVQARGRVSGTGAQLGVHLAEHPGDPRKAGAHPQGAEPLRLYRRRLAGRPLRRSRRDAPRLRPPGRHLGPRKPGPQRSAGHPVGGGRRDEVCPPRSAPGQHLPSSIRRPMATDRTARNGSWTNACTR